MRPVRGRTLALAAIGATAIAAAGVVGGLAIHSTTAADPTPSELATDRPCPELTPGPPLPRPDADFALVPVGEADQPITAAFLADGSGDGVLGERTGRARRVDAGRLTDEVVLDLRHDTMDEGDGGLLALAYSPRGDWLYAYRADADRDDVLTAYPTDADGRPDPEGGVVLLEIDHPDSVQHHGGALAVDPDGLLYLGLGDGGGLGDPRGSAQDPRTLLGKIVRIEPTPLAARPYRIPSDNPFLDRPGWRPEIWAIGVRNPFRLTLDGATGDLWLGDVGQSCWEELDRLPTRGPSTGGSNLGWDLLEATHPFEGGTAPGWVLAPEQEHNHRDGWCGIVAGAVLRGDRLPALDGHLVYSDYCRGRLYALSTDTDAEPRVLDTGLSLERPTAIVQGPDGDPWVLELEGSVSALVQRAR